MSFSNQSAFGSYVVGPDLTEEEQAEWDAKELIRQREVRIEHVAEAQAEIDLILEDEGSLSDYQEYQLTYWRKMLAHYEQCLAELH